MNKLWIYTFIIITFCSQCKRDKNKVQEDRYSFIKTYAIKNYSNVTPITYSGKVKESKEINVSFRIAGPIEKISVHEGDFIKKGQTLATIDKRDYQLQLKATEAEYKQIEQEVGRVVELYKRGSATQNDYDKAIAGLKQIKVKYEAHKNALKDTELKAPFDGYVQRKIFDAHETVDAGMPILTLINVSNLEVTINIATKEYLKQDQFQSFECYLEDYPNISIPLNLLKINRKSNLNQMYKTHLAITTPSKELPFKITPGMSVMVNLYMSNSLKSDRLFTVPITALLEKEEKNYLWKYNTELGTVTLIEMKIHKILRNEEAVVSGHLQVGDTIVVAGVHSLKENQKVKPLPKVSQGNIGSLM